ncbi:hypothetical protein [Pantoea allii]|uniref:hypothetical protein n=1 Tax=Pantoea allii TaxID=574096 RepID=UPI000A25C9E6|nr:hypothetical protein [Pantoea allii]MBW1251968.1 hypothetical protein [Pantoea allii]MBW1260565.1 hypothetical protein [Pantoea allii]MBW1283162.1 hypothetical protein [Pantoea allii]ORM84822.1 hypothetical protein HA38_14220 [Pantoea allii]PBJ98709.1 hypothetical protein CMR03_18590 [Pantoea allii]
MVRVEIAGIFYDIGKENGIYFARASSGQSPVGMTLEELSKGLANVTGLKEEDVYQYLLSLDI